MRVGLVGSSLPPSSPPSRHAFSSPWALRPQVSDSSCLVAPLSPCLLVTVSPVPRFSVSPIPHSALGKAARCPLPACFAGSPAHRFSVSPFPLPCTSAQETACCQLPLPAAALWQAGAASYLTSASPSLVTTNLAHSRRLCYKEAGPRPPNPRFGSLFQLRRSAYGQDQGNSRCVRPNLDGVVG